MFQIQDFRTYTFLDYRLWRIEGCWYILRFGLVLDLFMFGSILLADLSIELLWLVNSQNPQCLLYGFCQFVLGDSYL